ncbi:MAG: hypothetical protein M3Y41_15105 [Pseudomonadota bacterium]|nr:hypothetical protein [Pseudomonadota bacterium]
MKALRRRGMIGGLLPATTVALVGPAQAASDPDTSDLASDKPFIEHRLLLQLSDREFPKHALMLSVAYNMLKTFGPDTIAIDVVAFGPGIDLLLQASPNRQLVDSLVAQDVRFDICMNTVNTVERDTGQKLLLNPNAHPVEAGVARMLFLVERGYTVVRP